MVGLFFALAFGITWFVQLPAVLAHYGILPGPEAQYMNPAGLGLFGPMIAALIVARIEGGKGGTGKFFRSIWKWRVSPIWYVLALALPTVGFVIARGAYGLVAADGGPWTYPPENAQRVAAMIIAPIGEEIGWRGFALPRLQARFSRLNAAIILGFAWGFWHLMMYLMADISPSILIASILFLVPGSVLYSWIYNRSCGSALMAILIHMGTHLNNPNQVLSGTTTPFWISVVGYTLLGLVVLADRDAWKTPLEAQAPA